jgi:hypothetical protein
MTVTAAAESPSTEIPSSEFTSKRDRKETGTTRKREN